MIRFTLEIEMHEDGHYTVRRGERFCPDLTWDEMLGLVVRETHQVGLPRYPLVSMQQHIEHFKRRAERIAARNEGVCDGQV